MLVLTRKQSQMIRIGKDIVIKVIKTGRGTVKIGIEAPADVRVLRAELEEDDSQGPRPAAPNVDEMNLEVRGQGQVAMVWSDQFPHAV